MDSLERHMRLKLRLITFVAVANLAACGNEKSSPSSPLAGSQIVAEGITINVDRDRLVIRNTSAERVRFAALERVFVEQMLALWCFGSDECGTAIDAGQTAAVRLADVDGFSATSKEVKVFWWPFRPNVPADQKHQLLREVVVKIRD
jgi:hypothetical protein